MSHSDSTDDLEPKSAQAANQTSAEDALDAWLADDTVVALDDHQSPSTTDEPLEAASGPWHSLDPVSSWLLRVALLLVIVVLVTATAMVIYFMTAEKAPRTAVERDTAAAEIAVRERPRDAAAWQTLAYAYARGARYDDAITTIRRGRQSTREQALLLPEAEVLRAAGRYADSVPVYDSAVIAISQDESEAIAARTKAGLVMSAPNSSLIRAYFGRGLARSALGDTAGAIEDVLLALKLAPGQASMRVTLGDLYAKSNQAELARAAYTEALRFIPDDERALAGLKRLEEGN